MADRPSRFPVYGIGYSGRTIEDIYRIFEALDAYLVDIRFAPYSRNPNYRKGALERAFGARYVPLQAFGNPNHKSTRPLGLVDYEAGKGANRAGQTDARRVRHVSVRETPRVLRNDSD